MAVTVGCWRGIVVSPESDSSHLHIATIDFTDVVVIVVVSYLSEESRKRVFHQREASCY